MNYLFNKYLFCVNKCYIIIQTIQTIIFIKIYFSHILSIYLFEIITQYTPVKLFTICKIKNKMQLILMINDCKVQKHCKRIILMIISRMHHKLYKNYSTIFHNPHLFNLFSASFHLYYNTIYQI